MKMLLSYGELVELVDAGVINASKDHINGASIDITLDDTILREKFSILIEPVNLIRKDSLNLEKETIQNGIFLEPGEFILASSFEVFNLPNNIACEFKLKSSLARSGLQHALAGWCDPGWSNSKLTLELKNITRYHDLLLTPGMKIGQMVFYKCSEVPSEQSYLVKGQYNNQSEVTNNKGLR